MTKGRIPFDACPLCRHDDTPLLTTSACDWHQLYKPGLPPTINWLQCRACGHVFTDGYFDDEAMTLLLSDTNDSQIPGQQFEHARGVWAPTVARVAALVGSGSWLDVGFGDGALLFMAAEWGYDVTGIDVRPTTVDLMNHLGVTAHCIDIMDLDTSVRFDVMSFFDVLEHIPYPGQVLERAHQLINPGGCLAVSMPNMDSQAWRALDREGINPYWGEIEHYHNFTRARLVELLEEYGFRFAGFDIPHRWRLGMEVLAIRD